MHLLLLELVLRPKPVLLVSLVPLSSSLMPLCFDYFHSKKLFEHQLTEEYSLQLLIVVLMVTGG